MVKITDTTIYSGMMVNKISILLDGGNLVNFGKNKMTLSKEEREQFKQIFSELQAMNEEVKKLMEEKERPIMIGTSSSFSTTVTGGVIHTSPILTPTVSKVMTTRKKYMKDKTETKEEKKPIIGYTTTFVRKTPESPNGTQYILYDCITDVTGTDKYGMEEIAHTSYTYWNRCGDIPQTWKKFIIKYAFGWNNQLNTYEEALDCAQKLYEDDGNREIIIWEFYSDKTIAVNQRYSKVMSGSTTK